MSPSAHESGPPIGSGGGTDREAVEATLWNELLDFVGVVAQQLDLSGWSLGVCAVDGRLHTYNRGFSAATCAAYAVIEAGVLLPGPSTVRNGRPEYFVTREDAHREYPLTVGIDAGTRHHAAAVLPLTSPRGDRLGYLALHFTAPQQFGHHERARLERLAESVSIAIPVHGGGDGTVTAAAVMRQRAAA